jgi:hypothetical protein
MNNKVCYLIPKGKIKNKNTENIKKAIVANEKIHTAQEHISIKNSPKTVTGVNSYDLSQAERESFRKEFSADVSTDIYMDYVNGSITENQGKMLDARTKKVDNILSSTLRDFSNESPEIQRVLSELNNSFTDNATDGNGRSVGNGGGNDGGNGGGNDGGNGGGRDNNGNYVNVERSPVLNDAKKALSDAFLTIQKNMHDIDPQMSSLLSAVPNKKISGTNPYHSNKPITQAYDTAYAQYTNTFMNTALEHKTADGIAVKDLIHKKYGMLSPKPTIKEKNLAILDKSMVELITGSTPTTDISKGISSALQEIENKRKGTSDPDKKIVVDPILNTSRMFNNSDTVSAEFTNALNRIAEKQYLDLKNNGVISESQYTEMLANKKEKNIQNGSTFLNSISDKQKIVDEFKSNNIPSKNGLLNFIPNELFQDKQLVQFLIEKEYINTNPLATLSNTINKMAKNEAFTERFSGFGTITSNPTDVASLNRVKNSFAKNVLNISTENMNTLVSLERELMRNGLSPDQHSALISIYSDLGSNLNDWLHIKESLFNPRNNFMLDGTGVLDVLRSKGFAKNITDTQNRPVIGLYDETINLKDNLKRIENDKGTSERNRMLRLVKNMFQRRPTLMGDSLLATQDMITTYSNILTLAFTALSSAPEMMGGATKGMNGSFMFKSMGKTYTEWFTGLLPSKKKVIMQEAIDLGLICEKLSTTSLNSFIDAHGVRESANKGLDFLFHANMQEKWVGFTQAVNLQVAKYNLGEYARIANDANHPMRSKALKELSAYGLTPNDMLNWDGVIKKDFDLINARTGIDKKRKSIQDALFRYVDESVLRGSPATKSLLGNDPRYSLLWNLKSYIYSHYNKVVKPFYNRIGEIYKEGFDNYRTRNNLSDERLNGLFKFIFSKEHGRATKETLLSLSAVSMMYMPLAYAGWKIRELMQYTLFGEEAPSTQNSLGMNAYETVERAGLLGGGSFAHHAITSKSPAVETYSGVVSPTLGRIARLLRPDSEKLAKFTSPEVAAEVNNTMKIMSLIPIVSQLPGYKMATAKEITQNYVGSRKRRDHGNDTNY